MPEVEEYDPPLFQSAGDIDFQPLNETDDKYFTEAKEYLLKTSTLTGMNLYDHLARVLTKVLEERPCNPVDIFEELSKHEKRSQLILKDDSIVEKPDRANEVALARIQRKLFTRRGGGDTEPQQGEVDEAIEEEEEEEEEEDEDDENSPLPDLLTLCYNFEQAGVGLNREEVVRIWLALKTLVANHSFSKIRFWGKILGIQSNYVVAECEYEEGEESEDEEEEEEEGVEEEEEEKVEDEDAEDEAEKEEPLPKMKFKAPPVVPKEDKGTGANKFTYFVCSEPGKPWRKLPPVSPAQIVVSRKIKKFFTGNLDAPIVSYPPFDGREMHYLRAQIARISAGTQISPSGFYQGPEGDEGDEDEVGGDLKPNEEFEPIPVRDLIDPSLENWVHHIQHILPQGRVKWWNPKEAAGEEDEDEDEKAEEEEGGEEAEEIKSEAGPPFLTPISEDEDIKGMPAWTTRISSKLVPKYALAVIHSCLWPGAHAFARGSEFENIYIGWGHKYNPDCYSPEVPTELQEEYPSGPDITETVDPSVEEEAAYRAAHEEEEEEEEEDEDEGEDESAADDDED